MTLTEQQQNYRRQAALYVAQLERRLAAGEITQEKYDSELQVIAQAAPENADDAYWNEF